MSALTHDGKVRRGGKQVLKFAVIERVERRRRPGPAKKAGGDLKENPEEKGPEEFMPPKRDILGQARLTRAREVMDAPAFLKINIKTGVIEVDRVREVLGF